MFAVQFAAAPTARFAPFVANSPRLVANAFSFLPGGVCSLPFVVISCVVWPARCGAGHIFYAANGHVPLA